MSWIYSIVIAGLLFSSNGERAIKNTLNNNTAPTLQTAESIVKDETEKFEQTYPLDANGRVSVSNVNGSIVVEAWDRPEVRLEATKIADSRETLSEVEINVDSRPSYFSVEADYKGLKGRSEMNRDRKIEVQFRLSVPRTAVLNEIETVNGSVTVSNFVNFTKISAVNGNVSAGNLRGAANLSTVNGEVNADFDRLEPGSKISLSTVNGRVNLVIPSDANATIKADSLNGEITNGFGLPVRKGEYIGRDLYGRIGSGDVQIKLDSVNGPLTINRRSDGKAPNPATDLLKQKKSDDDEWSRTTGINREVARAVRETQRAVANIPVPIPPIDLKELEKLNEISKIAIDETIKLDIDKKALDQLKRQAAEIERSALARIAQVNWPIGAPTIEKKRNKFSVKGTPTVTVEAKGCSVRVRGWDKPEVQYVVTEIAGRPGREPISVTDDQKGGDIALKITNPNEDRTFSGMSSMPDRVRIDIYVPHRSNLRIVTDGEIRLDGVSGEIDLSGGDEPINIRDVDGKLKLAADDGLVRVIGFKGEFTSKTADGDMYLEGDFQKLSARAIDGAIMLTLPGDANASITSNAEIESDGIQVTRENERSWRLGRGGAKYDFDLVDGSVMIRNASLIDTY